MGKKRALFENLVNETSFFARLSRSDEKPEKLQFQHKKTRLFTFKVGENYMPIEIPISNFIILESRNLHKKASKTHLRLRLDDSENSD